MNHATKLGSDFVVSKDCLPNHIPIGSVEYCESIMETDDDIKNFYPEFLSDFKGRNIELIDVSGEILIENKFVKLARRWKADFKSQIVSSMKLTGGTYYVSDIVKFVQEWRYYVLNGEVITTGWYDGVDDNEPAPELKVKYPEHFCGAVDFGKTDLGEILLVESHAPYACGWYGENNYDYAYWMYNAYPNYLKNKEVYLLNDKK
jgi:hypothetical protein